MGFDVDSQNNNNDGFLNSDGVYVATGYVEATSTTNGRSHADAAATAAAEAGPPDSLRRVKWVLCESKVFAA